MKYAIQNINNGDVTFYDDLEDAAVEILTYDSQHYEVRPIDDGHALFTKGLNDRDYSQSVIFSLETDANAAREDIFKQVVDFSGEAFGGSDRTYCQPLASYISDLKHMMADDDSEGLAELLRDAETAL